MSWTEELYKIYDYNSKREFTENEPVMLPVAHSTIDVHLEVTILEDGELADLITRVDKSDKTTIRPNTGEAKTGKNPPPFPLTESIKYLAGDFNKFKPADTEKKTFNDNTSFYDAYLKIMQDWNDSEFSHKAVSAVLKYVSKAELISDCIRSGVLELDENGLLKPKQYGVDVDKVTIRFNVHYKNIRLETRTWKDTSLYDSFLRFNSSSRGNEQLCYALGKVLPSQYIHPSQILKGAINAKLISSNDESGFSYRGRFFDKTEALSVSYVFSEKMHNALKWLIETQSIVFRRIRKDDKTTEIKTLESLTVIVWASALQERPEIAESFLDEDNENELPSTNPMYMKMLKKRMLGLREKFKPNTKVMVMGLDAATTGRINISMYSELEGSQYLDNIERWHSETAWLQFNGKLLKKQVNSFSLYDIIKYAYGTEQGSYVECDKKIVRDNILRLLNCVTNGTKLPADIVEALRYKASNPLAYDKEYNHRKVLEIACGMIRKQRIDNKKGDVSMAYDPEIKDRSYLFGCLLAIADKAENEAYDDEDRNVRVTNARRYWSAFSQRPYMTWGIIYDRLRPYLNKLGKAQVKYSKWINEITTKMNEETFKNNSRLEPLYLLGYHNFTEYMFDNAKNKEEK